jgi:hypothetical protein
LAHWKIPIQILSSYETVRSDYIKLAFNVLVRKDRNSSEKRKGEE